MLFDVIYDIETFPNVFLLTAEHTESSFRVVYEISDWRDDSNDIRAFLSVLKEKGSRMIGFNNLGFDYPVIHHFLRHGKANARNLYDKAQAIFDSQNTDQWAHYIKPSDILIPQIDLFKIHHFDNKAKTTSLKNLQFVMRSDSVQDLPFLPGTALTGNDVDLLREYNIHDVTETKKFYEKSKEMISFREELTKTFSRDFINHNDTKIGKDFFVMELERAGVSCYDFGSSGRKPKQTLRSSIRLDECILPWITFEQPEFNRILNWFKEQIITETKNVYDNVTCRINGFEYVFGLGGIHGSVKSKIIRADDKYMIVDLDVASFYPNLAIINNLRPEHLGLEFCRIYKQLYEQRKKEPKGSARNAMLKLALNGVYGDSNNIYSVFYDPQYTMSITVNGQLLICLLAEMLIDHCDLVQVNTDGLTVKIERKHHTWLREQCKQWEQKTGLSLEENQYLKMAIRDVNNYIAVDINGRVKRKGAYEYVRGWHQDHSALVVPKVAEKVLVEGVAIRDTTCEWKDNYDFLMRTKVPRTSKLILDMGDQEIIQQNNTRYYVSKTGGNLIKRMPPLKNKTEWRNIRIESGRKVTVYNDIKDVNREDIDYDYYIDEIEKLVLCLN